MRLCDYDSDQTSGISHGTLGSNIGFLLLAGWRQAQSEFMSHFKGVDITPATFGILHLVAENPGCAVGQVGRAMGIAANNIARMVDQLCKRGLLAKTISKGDARIRTLEITDSGAQFLRELDERHAVYENAFTAQLGQDRVDALRALLRPFLKFENPLD
ncbi:MAG: MarR family transcriptional regulator [Croceibacterium sp.]